MDNDGSDGAVTPEQFTEEVMRLFDSNMPLEEMRLRIEQLFRRAVGVGALSRQTSPSDRD
ncbi:hypothetical protein [Aureimonas leprariae]|uniref:Uncharacterized protein n=1 Tax=Plantimonas leprariae TaxID=2615207 RepID=A0A7V7PR66_9HYPH|nr:hypothetical protein [Aureimonas leprariae]KAB0680917.1 hypothetical protein F6X38_08020 [Aureimonas leprariae]